MSIFTSQNGVDVLLLYSESIAQDRTVDTSEVHAILEISPVIQIRQARMSPVYPSRNSASEQEQRGCCPVIRSPRAVLVDATTELRKRHDYNTLVKLVNL